MPVTCDQAFCFLFVCLFSRVKLSREMRGEKNIGYFFRLKDKRASARESRPRLVSLCVGGDHGWATQSRAFRSVA